MLESRHCIAQTRQVRGRSMSQHAGFDTDPQGRGHGDKFSRASLPIAKSASEPRSNGIAHLHGAHAELAATKVSGSVTII